jgi:hypothetical protein
VLRSRGDSSATDDEGQDAGQGEFTHDSSSGGRKRREREVGWSSLPRQRTSRRE